MNSLLEILRAAPEAAAWIPESGRESEGFKPDQLTLVATNHPVIGGFAAARIVADEAELLNIAVRPECRKQGLASLLLTRLLEHANRKGVGRMFLEVRESNQAAIALYEKCGFAQTGVRRGYYRNPDESALIFTKTIDAKVRRGVMEQRG